MIINGKREATADEIERFRDAGIEADRIEFVFGRRGFKRVRIERAMKGDEMVAFRQGRGMWRKRNGAPI